MNPLDTMLKPTDPEIRKNIEDAVHDWMLASRRIIEKVFGEGVAKDPKLVIAVAQVLASENISYMLLNGLNEELKSISSQISNLT